MVRREYATKISVTVAQEEEPINRYRQGYIWLTNLTLFHNLSSIPVYPQKLGPWRISISPCLGRL